MPATIPTERVDFRCRGIRCAAWLTLPAGRGPHPAVVLAHGLGATHDMMLPQYEQHFAAAGIATLAFDYRNTGPPTVNRASTSRRGNSVTTSRRQSSTSSRGRRSTAAGSDCGAPASAA